MNSNSLIMMPLFIMLLCALVAFPEEIASFEKNVNQMKVEGALDPFKLFSILYGFAAPIAFFLSIIVIGIIIILILGIRGSFSILGSGVSLSFSETTVRVVGFLLIFLGIWGLLSSMAFPMFSDAGFFGILVYALLTFIYLMGLMFRLSTFGAE